MANIFSMCFYARPTRTSGDAPRPQAFDLTFTPYQVMISREEVLEIVKGHLVDTIEELEGVEIDPSRSMKDLGANSLDIVEVVSCSMRDLKIKVPRSELNTLENMNQLVDLLFRVASEKQAAQA